MPKRFDMEIEDQYEPYRIPEFQRSDFQRYTKELVSADLPGEITKNRYGIGTSQDFVLSKLSKKEIKMILAQWQLILIHDTFRRPPQRSIFKTSPEGNPKLRMSDNHVAAEMDSWNIARVMRAIDGFEREKQVQSINVQVGEALPRRKPTWRERIFGGV